MDGATMRFSARSDIGAVRTTNEDGFLSRMPVFLVADGMGGHAFGDIASQRIVQVFESRFPEGIPMTSGTVVEAISAANSAVRALSGSGAKSTSVAGSTLAGIALVRSESENHFDWMAFNVGDSRIYTWNNGVLRQLTVDHSAVQELLDLGQITSAEARGHPERNVITRALGIDDDADPDVWLMPAVGRQAFIICTDGLTKELSDSEVTEIVRECEEADQFEAIAERLVRGAVDAGGSDNVTVVAVEVEWVGSATGADDSTARLPEFLEETVPRR